MSRKILVFCEYVVPDQQAQLREQAVLSTAGFLAGRLQASVDIILWGETTLENFPATLADARLHHLEEMPTTSLLATVDIAAIATGLINLYKPDVILFSTSMTNSNMHLLAAACAFLLPADFFFGVTGWKTDDPDNLFFWRPGNENLLEIRLELPLVLGITHDAGLDKAATATVPTPTILTTAELGMELDIIQMRSALFPEPVSIIETPNSHETDFESAISWFTSDVTSD